MSYIHLEPQPLTETEQQLLDLVTHYNSKLTEWEEKFVENMQQTVEDITVHSLTAKQKAKIAEIFNRIDGE